MAELRLSFNLVGVDQQSAVFLHRDQAVRGG